MDYDTVLLLFFSVEITYLIYFLNFLSIPTRVSLLLLQPTLQTLLPQQQAAAAAAAAAATPAVAAAALTESSA